MSAIEAILGPITLCFALAGTPYLLVRNSAPRLSWPATIAAAGATAILLNTLIPVLLHVMAIPITTMSLVAAHAKLAILALAALLARRYPIRPEGTDGIRPLLLLTVAFAVLVVPITHLAGIDTYKWQGLATNVAVESGIPWLVHPVSLLGFTPRAYPSAQPLVLATAQIMGGLGVDGGYFVVSLLSGVTGLFSAYLLGKACFDGRALATWFACFYVFSPVFMRYSHWATGRGFFLALYPLFILMLLRFPRALAWIGIIVLGALLALCHKVGLVSVAVLLPFTLVSFMLPRTHNRILVLLLALPFVAVAFIMSPPLALPAPAGLGVGFVRASITRFGWMIPFCALALAARPDWLMHPARRRLFPAMLATFPLAYPPDIYGAMMALPFIILAATSGVDWVRERWPRMRKAIQLAVTVLTALAALVIVEYRNINATPKHVYKAAQFLEFHDPRGPFQVHAPGRARVQIHAYVSGCPRFLVTPGQEARLTLRRPPPILGSPQKVAREWIDFGRNLMELDDLAVDWYGKNPRDYYVTIDGEGERPPENAKELYRDERVTIHKPGWQEDP